jgi:hypothetical protein
MTPEMTKGFYMRLWLTEKIKAHAKNIVLHCQKPKTATRCDSYPTPCWILPSAGWVCANVDAALFPDGSRMGWGAEITPVLSSYRLLMVSTASPLRKWLKP